MSRMLEKDQVLYFALTFPYPLGLGLQATFADTEVGYTDTCRQPSSGACTMESTQQPLNFFGCFGLR